MTTLSIQQQAEAAAREIVLQLQPVFNPTDYQQAVMNSGAAEIILKHFTPLEAALVEAKKAELAEHNERKNIEHAYSQLAVQYQRTEQERDEARREVAEWKQICKNRDETVKQQGDEWVKLKMHIDQLSTDNQRLREAIDILIEAGRPHSGNPLPEYPSGCECEQCEAWDKLSTLAKTPPPSSVQDLELHANLFTIR